MLKNLPATPEALIAWTWAEIEVHVNELAAGKLDTGSVTEWLTDWTRLGEKLEELYARLALATAVNTADKGADARVGGVWFIRLWGG